MIKYRISTKSKYLEYLKRGKAKQIKKDDDAISFITDKKNKELFEALFPFDSVENITKRKSKRILKKYIITILGLSFIIIVLINLSCSITKISFVESDSFDEEVYQYIDSELYHFGPWKYLQKSLSDINYNLRSKFYTYEWIGLTKKGTTIFVQIEKSYHDGVSLRDEIPGNLYAKYDAIIKGYHLEKGIVKVQEEQSVLKDDLLISGEIVHYDSSLEYIHPIGYVKGEVLRYFNTTIPFYEEKIIRSGKMTTYDYWVLNQKPLNKFTSEYENYEVEYETLFSFLNFKYIRAYVYELIEVKTVYYEDEAIEFALSQFYKSFYEEKKYPFEKIIFHKLASVEKDEEKYTIKFVIKTIQNIVYFKKLS